MVREVIVERDFGGEPDDRDHLDRARSNGTTPTCIAEIAPDRLLVYRSPRAGSRCARSSVSPVPDEPFPRMNDRESFGRRNDDDAT